MSVKEAKNEFVRAEKSLKSADVLLNNGFYEDAISRAYYAILHSAKASLILNDINVESHKGVRRLFSQHLTKTGEIEDKYAKILSAEQDERLKADYDVLYFADEEDARECVSDAREFLAAIKNYLKEQGVHLGIEQK